MENDIQEILFTREEIYKRVSEIGAQITEDFKAQLAEYLGQ